MAIDARIPLAGQFRYNAPDIAGMVGQTVALRDLVERGRSRQAQDQRETEASGEAKAARRRAQMLANTERWAGQIGSLKALPFERRAPEYARIKADEVRLGTIAADAPDPDLSDESLDRMRRSVMSAAEQLSLERQQQADARAKFQFDAGIAANSNLAEIAPGQTSRTVPLEAVDPEIRRMQAAGVLPAETTAPLGEVLEYGGRRFAPRSHEERRNDAIRQAKTAAAMRLGELMEAERVKAMFRSPAASPRPLTATDDAGTVTLISPDGKVVGKVERAGKTKKAESDAAGRRSTEAKQAKIDALQRDHDNLHEREQKVRRRQKEVRELLANGLYRPGNGAPQRIADPAMRNVALTEIASLQEEADSLRDAKNAKLRQKDAIRGGGAPSGGQEALPGQVSREAAPRLPNASTYSELARMKGWK